MDAISLVMLIVMAFLICYLIYQFMQIILAVVNNESEKNEKKKKDEELVTCDKCGHDFKRKYIQHITYNSSYPTMSNKIWREVDICENCYADAMMPFLNALKGRITEYEEK
jgi:predicted membrane protein